MTRVKDPGAAGQSPATTASRPDRRAEPDGRPRLPRSTSARHSLLAIAATAAGTVGLVPGTPHALSALLIVIFVGAGPGCALLAWLPALPVSRMFLVPTLGLTAVIIVTAVAATFGWWSPHALFGVIALITVWSVVPNLRALIHDMVP